MTKNMCARESEIKSALECVCVCVCVTEVQTEKSGLTMFVRESEVRRTSRWKDNLYNIL